MHAGDAMDRHRLTAVPLLAIAAAAAALACVRSTAATARSRTEISAASIETAQALGAGRAPEAAERLASARDNLARALQLIEEGEDEKANGFLVRAEADAELAASLAREARLREEAEHTAARAHWGRR